VCLVGKQNKPLTLFKVTEPSSVCVECLVGELEQNTPTLFDLKVTEPSSVPYRAASESACAKRAANPDPPPVIPVPESIAAQAAYQLRYENTEYYSWVGSGPFFFGPEIMMFPGIMIVLLLCWVFNWKTKKPILFKVTEPNSTPYKNSSQNQCLIKDNAGIHSEHLKKKRLCKQLNDCEHTFTTGCFGGVSIETIRFPRRRIPRKMIPKNINHSFSLLHKCCALHASSPLQQRSPHRCTGSNLGLHV
jgi:hypothetical protein